MLNKALLLASARQLGAAAQPFAPDHIPGLVLWLDADDESSVMRDGSNRVSQWSDKSGDGKHAVMANATYQPTYVASAINGRGAIDFENAKYLELPDLTGISGSSNRSFSMVGSLAFC